MGPYPVETAVSFELERKRLALDETQPDYDAPPPSSVRKTGRKKGVLYVAGEGPEGSDVMVVGPHLEEDDAQEFGAEFYGKRLKERARHLKGVVGGLLRDVMDAAMIDPDSVYYTTLVKWLLPRNRRNRITKKISDWAMPALEDELRRVKPRIVVAMGKVVFDRLVPGRLSLDEARYGWFDTPLLPGAKVFLLDKPSVLLNRPAMLEQFRMAFRDVRRMLDKLEGRPVEVVATDYRLIRDAATLRAWVGECREAGRTRFAVDCEWHGLNFVDGQLRSIQFAWAPGEGVCVMFRDERNEYAFDAPYAEAGKILAEWMNRPEVRYIGHHYAADAPWMSRWLGLEWYGKCDLDTEFAMQLVDEHHGLGLEDLAMSLTDMGRYDLPLILWKKQNPGMCDDGYGFIPEDIIFPYSVADVDVCVRAAPWLEGEMERQGLVRYYRELLNPYATDLFTWFAIDGLPVDRRYMDDMRDLYQWALGELETELRRDIHEEAKVLLTGELVRAFGPFEAAPLSRILTQADDPVGRAKELVPRDAYAELLPFLEHLRDSPSFNMRSKPQMVRWLFDVKRHVPVKSTANLAKGLRSTPWEKVLEMKPEERREYNPATDAETLEILGEKDPIVSQLLAVSLIGNLCKAFLKEPTLDEETGRVTRENGLHYWIAGDGRLHGMLSTTETGRPRSWKPNSLNWPKYVASRLAGAVMDLLKRRDADGRLPGQFREYLDGGRPIPVVRSIVRALDGWCFPESDYQTAEVRGLAFISGDAALISILTDEDRQFARLKDGSFVRIRFLEGHGVPRSCWEEHSDVLFRKADGSKADWPEFDRGEDGKLVHAPKRDLHWELAEMVKEAPREKLSKPPDRNGIGKIGNFKTAYGAAAPTLERQIEAATGHKPEPGTGQRILDALAERQPDATEFLEWLAELPGTHGRYRAASGRLRHFVTHASQGAKAFVPGRHAKRLLASQGREARNFPMQESVAATAMRAGVAMLRFKRMFGLRGGPVAILYDSVVTHCPLCERHLWVDAHDLWMHEANGWLYNGRVLKYPIDNEFNLRWSEAPSDEETERLASRDWEPEPENLAEARAYLDNMRALHRRLPSLSVYNADHAGRDHRETAVE